MEIQLWDLKRLSDLFLEAYADLDEPTQELVALRQIWVLDDPDNEGE